MLLIYCMPLGSNWLYFRPLGHAVQSTVSPKTQPRASTTASARGDLTSLPVIFPSAFSGDANVGGWGKGAVGAGPGMVL